MDNPETLATLGTQDAERRQSTKTQHRKLRRWATQTPLNSRDEPRCCHTDSTKHQGWTQVLPHRLHWARGMNPGARKWYAGPLFYKTPTTVLIVKMCCTPLYASIHKWYKFEMSLPTNNWGKDEPNTVYMRKSQYGTKNVNTYDRTTCWTPLCKQTQTIQ